jgi:excisionase family DNA binding protein
MPSEPTRAVYVRMPDRLARKLDSAAERLGASKRDILAALVNNHLDLDGDNLVVALPNIPTPATTTVPAQSGEVLTVEETASMLRVEPDDVLALIEAGELHARRIGGQWRLARSSVLGWLRGDEPGSGPAERP